MKFCKVCQNMYYIKLNENNPNTIVYYCRNCGDEDETVTNDNIVVSKTNYKNNSKKFDSIINEYTHLDPTLPRTKLIKCPNDDCISNNKIIKKENEESYDEDHENNNEIIYLRYDDVNIKYVYLCSNCHFVWTNEN